MVWPDRGCRGGGTTPKCPTWPAIFPAQNWQFIIATLSQWLGCFRVEPRAEILHQKRQSVPLPPPINRFDLHASWVDIIVSKVGQKPPSSLEFFLFCRLSLHTLSLSAIPTTTFITAIVSATISTTGSQYNHHPATTTTGPLPLQIFFFFFLPATATISRHRLHRPNLLVAAKLPPQVSVLPLPFLLPFFFFFGGLHYSRCMWIVKSNPLFIFLKKNSNSKNSF